MTLAKTKILFSLLAAASLLTANCGRDHSSKKGGVDDKQREDEHPNQNPLKGGVDDKQREDEHPNQNPLKGGSDSEGQNGISSSVSMSRVNGRVLHSHILFIFYSNLKSPKVKSAKVNGITIQDGSEILGDANQYLKGTINKDTLNKIKLSAQLEQDEEYKKEILEQHKDQPFFFAEGFTDDLHAEGVNFKFEFVVEGDGSSTTFKTEINNPKE